MILIDLNNKPEWYKKLNPAGTVPTLEFDDQTINDSYEILEYLDTTYPDPPLNPPSNKEAEEITGMCVAIIHPYIWAIFSIQLSTSNSIRCPSICPSIHPFIHLSIHSFRYIILHIFCLDQEQRRKQQHRIRGCIHSRATKNQ